MSYLGRKMAADKMSNAARAANRNGDDLASATLLLLASIYLLGRDDLMKYVWVTAQAAAETADEEKLRRRGITPPGPDKGDRVDEALEVAARFAFLDGEESLSGLFSFVRSLRTVGRDDLLRQLYDVAESLTCKALGHEPSKDIYILEGAGDDAPAS